MNTLYLITILNYNENDVGLKRKEKVHVRERVTDREGEIER